MANGLRNGLDEKAELFYSGVTVILDAAGQVDLGEGRSYPLVKIQKWYGGDRTGNQPKGVQSLSQQT